MVFIVRLPRRAAGSATAAEPEVDADGAVLGAALSPEVAGGSASAPTTPPRPESSGASSAKEATRAATHATLDVLLAPSVLKHRYVRGVDKSNIVERPERIRAVLLGVAGALGIAERERGKTDIADALAKLNVEERLPLRVLTTSRTKSLDTPDAALREIHAHTQEPVRYASATAYAEARHARIVRTQGADFAPSDRSSAHTAPRTHAERISFLAQLAPTTPPGMRLPRERRLQDSDMSSSDGEGDDRMHLSEVPGDLPQGDLYLCGPHAAGARDTSDGGSREAICHALGACAEAVDRVIAAAQAAPPTLAAPHIVPGQGRAAETLLHVPARRAFVLARPPGHHCTGFEPSGFCWVNNVAVAAAHAYDAHKVDRIIVLDIDLHHGNGTQALAWRMNADAVGHDADRAARLAAQKSARTGGTRSATRQADARPPWEQLLAEEALAGPRAQRVYYGSLHDIESFPCEDGDAELVRNASVCLAGAHGQWIWNGTSRDRGAAMDV